MCSRLLCWVFGLGSNDPFVVCFERHFLEPEKMDCRGELLSGGGTLLHVSVLGSQIQGSMPQTKPSTRQGPGQLIDCPQLAFRDGCRQPVIGDVAQKSGHPGQS